MDTEEQGDTDSIHRTSGNYARSKAGSGAGSRGGSRAGSAESSSRQNPLNTPSGSSRRPPQPYSGQASRSCVESDASLQAMPGGSRSPMTPGVDPASVGTGSTLGSFSRVPLEPQDDIDRQFDKLAVRGSSSSVSRVSNAGAAMGSMNGLGEMSGQPMALQQNSQYNQNHYAQLNRQSVFHVDAMQITIQPGISYADHVAHV